MLTESHPKSFPINQHQADLCVVGGGRAGLSAAIAAARRGAKVILMQDRPVLGGNASSEIRMWVRGAHGENLRETGILEELALENLYRNPSLNFSIWDSVLWGAAQSETNLQLILNCSCCDLTLHEGRIRSIRGWQLTTQTWHEVTAGLFADCSGDSILAPLAGAKYRQGREAKDQFDESIEPLASDAHTMGMSCLLQARETAQSRPFIAPKWAYQLGPEDFSHRLDLENPESFRDDNFWWLELGGEMDGIKDTEIVRDELLKTAFGVWDFIKNSGRFKSDCWELDWVGFLPGKRESRRYVGDLTLTQDDIRTAKAFPDTVAYGGWTMDDHHPAGFCHPGAPNVFHPAPSPYRIPYRCLYSRNVDNLFCAGRNLSASHAALSSTRVMATCAMLGQAVGTAAALAIREGLSPREVYRKRLQDLQQQLQEDDCYLPGRVRMIPPLTLAATLTASDGDPKRLIDGHDRPDASGEHLWRAPFPAWIEFAFDRIQPVGRMRLVLDSDLNRESLREVSGQVRTFPMRCNIPLRPEPVALPSTLLKSFRVDIHDPSEGWQTVFSTNENTRRLIQLDLGRQTDRIRIIPQASWGKSEARIFSIDFSEV